jgi:putative peptidoglycan lipid II flippase
MAVGTAVFPTLSEESARQHRGQVERVFMLSLRMILFVTIPAGVGLMVLGEPVIRLFFERNQFGPDSTRATAHALVFYAIGLAGHATVEIVDRVFYALHDTRTPVLVAVGAIGANVALSLVLMQTPLGYGGLALATSLAALGEGAVLIHLIGRHLPGLRLDALGVAAVRILAAALVMGWPVAWLAQQLDPPLRGYGFLGGAAVAGVCALAGAALYAGASFVFGSEELRALTHLVRRR